MRIYFACLLLMGTVNLNAFTSQTCHDGQTAVTPNERFTVHHDGTVTDNRTGLIWKRCIEGQSGSDCTEGTATQLTWDKAIQHAETSHFAGTKDWRLPSVKELASVVEAKCTAPAINLTIFPNTPNSWVWSSSLFANNASMAWSISFDVGDGSSNHQSYVNHVRLVRDGKSKIR